MQTTIWHITGKSFGFFVPFFIATWFGINKQTDAFFFSYSIIWFAIVVSSNIGRTLAVPFIASKRSKSEDINAFLSSTISQTVIYLLCSMTICLLLLKPLLEIITKFEPKTIDLIMLISLILSLTVVFYTAGSFIEGLLNYNKKFWFSSLALAIRSIFIILIMYLLRNKVGIFSIVLGYIIGEGIYFLLLYYCACIEFKFKFKWNIKPNVDTIHFFKAAFSQIIFVILTACNPLIDRAMASFLGTGSISLLEYSEKIYFIFYNMVPFVLSRVLLTYWSESFYEHENKNFHSNVISTAIKAVLITLPVCFIVYYFKYPITHFALNRGNFPDEKLLELSNLVGYNIFLLIPTIILMFFINYFIVIKAINVLILIGFVKLILNIIGNIIGIKLMGLPGIILSSVFHTTISASILLFIFLRHRKMKILQ